MEDKPTSGSAVPPTSEAKTGMDVPTTSENKQASLGDRKRKRDRFERNTDSLKHGSRNKRRDLGRKEWSRVEPDRRQRNDDEQAKQGSHDSDAKKALPTPFSPDEIAAEDRRPKRKVAVMIGNASARTIEGDLFAAFVAAGAISKANADDPKKSALVRCARTDKGVHAAGNVISLKLIVEDHDIVQKINDALNPQIRVWGIERTVGSFSSYQACDSRWYEYLIPSHVFLPPHPSSWLARKCEERADEMNDRDGYETRQAEVKGWWQEVEQRDIKPIVDSLDEDIRDLVTKALYETIDTDLDAEFGDVDSVVNKAVDDEQPIRIAQLAEQEGAAIESEKTESAVIVLDIPQTVEAEHGVQDSTQSGEDRELLADSAVSLPPISGAVVDDSSNAEQIINTSVTASLPTGATQAPPIDPQKQVDIDRRKRIDAAIRILKSAYQSAKRTYRISPARVSRVQAALDQYLKTHNFHNYTIQKPFRDPSARRTIRSFVVNPEPVMVNGTEWLSLKVHGQSFMMHQIRKMVGMVALIVRCGCVPRRILETYADVKVSIPKVPGLGLLLERPVFDSYNEKQASKHGREKIDFSKYEKEMLEFKQREIYERIFREEERDNTFHQFFNHIDNYKEPYFLFVTSKGIAATQEPSSKQRRAARQVFEEESDDEEGSVNEGG
ncbi:tRNA pseudouridine synthase 1 [Elasticomyces elasticus]|nr:tRNA pseudouridine synthase 1 [Elasticomyces elasticus]